MHDHDHDDDEYKYDYDHTEIDHDSDNKEILGHDFNPVEEGSALHLEIHRAVDELGKYAIELEIMPEKPISKDDMKAFAPKCVWDQWETLLLSLLDSKDKIQGD